MILCGGKLCFIKVAGLNNAEQIGTAVGISKHTVYELVSSLNYNDKIDDGLLLFAY